MSRHTSESPQVPVAIVPAQLSDRQLIAALEKRSEKVPQLEAVKELNRRRSPMASRVMTRIVTDLDSPADIRAAAAVELGRTSRKSHRQALSEALRSKTPAVVRRAAEALGRIGDGDDLERLAAVRSRRPEVVRSVRFARTLLSYRLGLDRYRLKTPREQALLEVRADAAFPLRLRTVTSDTLEELSDSLRRELPTLPLSRENVQSFVCGQNRFLIGFHRQVHRWSTLSPLQRRSAVVLIVLKRSQVLGRYFVHEYLLSHPAQGDRIRVFGVRPSGVLTHYGVAVLSTHAATARLRTVDNPHTPPVDIRCDYDHAARNLTFSSALLNPQTLDSQRTMRQPRRIIAAAGSTV